MVNYPALMEEHNRKISALAEKYIGSQEMQRGLFMADVWFRKEWYINRIKQLMFQAGRCNERLRRCKPDSLKWKHYEQTAQECELLADNLGIDLRSL